MIGFAKSENKSLLIFKSLKQDIDLNVKLEKKNHDFFFNFGGNSKFVFFFTIVASEYYRYLTQKKNAYQHTEL